MQSKLDVYLKKRNRATLVHDGAEVLLHESSPGVLCQTGRCSRHQDAHCDTGSHPEDHDSPSILSAVEFIIYFIFKQTTKTSVCFSFFFFKFLRERMQVWMHPDISKSSEWVFLNQQFIN